MPTYYLQEAGNNSSKLYTKPLANGSFMQPANPNSVNSGSVVVQPNGTRSVTGTLGASTNVPSGVTGGGGGQAPTQPLAGQDIQKKDINNQVDQFGQILDRDFNTAMDIANQQESGLKSQAGYATGQVEAGYAPARTQIQNEQTTNEAGLTSQANTAQTQSANAMQQARDLFRQTQQQNIAQLSGLGISSSSVAEALAETLGVETARRIAGITGSRDEIINNVAKERTRVQTYYQSKLSDLETQVGQAKADIQNSLMQGINQINQSRTQAASDKANRRQELLTNAQSKLSELVANAQQFQQSLDTWAAQKNEALKPITDNPAFLDNLTNNTNVLNTQAQYSGFNFTPTIDYNAQGQITGAKVSGTKTKTDELTNPFTTATQ
jgi:hypothetical protein